MKVSKKVNAARRSLMRGLTKNVGKSHSASIVQKNIPIKKILISRPNHRLGNLLLLSPLVQEVMETFPDAKIDLFVKGGVTPVIYKNYRNIDKIIQLPKKPFSSLFQYIKGWATLKSRKYDLVINASYGSSSGKLSTSMARAEYRVFGDTDEKLQAKFSDYRHAAKNSIYSLRDFLSHLNIDRSNAKIPDLDIKLSDSEIEEGKVKLYDLVKNDKKSICLFTNATGAKCYSEEWWNSFYDKLETAFPNYNIVELLPVENISKINFRAPSFYSKDIREMGGFITNCKVFIAADNGVMHLASAVNTSTVGLFMVTEEDVYKPYNEGSFAINTNEHSADEIINLLKNIL